MNKTAVNVYLQKKTMGWIWPGGHSLLTPGLHKPDSSGFQLDLAHRSHQQEIGRQEESNFGVLILTSCLAKPAFLY